MNIPRACTHAKRTHTHRFACTGKASSLAAGLGRYECPQFISPNPGEWTAECAAAQIHSSPGATGSYPLVDRRLGYHYYLGYDSPLLGVGAAVSAVFRDTLKPLVDQAVLKGSGGGGAWRSPRRGESACES
jgi:hypothetical protein